MGLLNPDYDPQIELVDFINEVQIWDIPFNAEDKRINHYKCPAGFSKDREMLIRYAIQALSQVFIVESHKDAENEWRYCISIRCYDPRTDQTFDVGINPRNKLFDAAIRAASATIGMDLTPVQPMSKPTAKIMYIDSNKYIKSHVNQLRTPSHNARQKSRAK